MEYSTKTTEVKRFATLYERYLKLFRLQGRSDATINAYSRAVRHDGSHLDSLPCRVN